MSHRYLVAAAAFFLLLALPLVGQESLLVEGTSVEARLQQLYLDYLNDLATQPHIDEDGDVEFRYDGGIYYIIVDEDDPEYFSIIYPNFWEIESEEEHAQALVATDYATAISKVAKIYIVDANVWASVEMVLPQPEDFTEVFDRAMRLLQNGTYNFVLKMKELSE
ncbi:hypothetical protein Spith_1701 [Spirochaeta thermophila DSM 6578]|uniref:Uncharacterized protein n=1 Tax=Winmispira thermophila (strain ATCC 700085 / DSM 6578 / Z-1203) TaxID=869211 RepID=G0GBV0_WINT7|nr:hypothetical protein [Spirochaeta thermophila]AEJ61961.1 hypothetical protein Spith_1701 [Spirochaeta thermophila DSM 6578]